MSADSPTDVWAVGQVVLHFDGTKWSAVRAPIINGLPNGNSLNGVAALAGNDVWAVGVQFDRRGQQHPLIERFDGTEFSVVASPALPPGASLVGITAISADDIFAVGSC